MDSEDLVLSVSTPEPSTLGLGATHTLYLLWKARHDSGPVTGILGNEVR